MRKSLAGQPGSINVLFSVLKGEFDPSCTRISKIKKENSMRKLVLLLLAFVLTACGAAPATATQAPAEVVAQPTQTAMVVVETVVVTVVPTDMPTEVPSATPLPPPTEVPPTAVPPTQAVSAPAETTSGGPITVDDALGAGWFVNMTRSKNELALRCQLNKEITFYVKATDPNITMVDFFYRIVDKSTGTAFEWQSGGRMIPDGSGGFTLTFSGDQVNANYRKPSAWLDYQFAGSNNTGVVGRSEKIEKQINYSFDC